MEVLQEGQCCVCKEMFASNHNCKKCQKSVHAITCSHRDGDDDDATFECHNCLSFWNDECIEEEKVDPRVEKYDRILQDIKAHFGVNSDRPMAVQLTDGEQKQLDEIFAQYQAAGTPIPREICLIAAKLNASRSAVDQACDQHMFLVLKKFIKCGTHKKLAPFTDVKDNVKTILKDLVNNNKVRMYNDKMSVIANAFLTLPWDIMEALHPVTVAGCWADVGMNPFNFMVIAQNTPGWGDLTFQEQKKIFEFIPELCLIMLLIGRLEEDDLKTAGCPPDQNGNERNNKGAFHRHRASFLSVVCQLLRHRIYMLKKNDKHMLKLYKDKKKAEEKEVKDQEKANRRAADEKEKERKKEEKERQQAEARAEKERKKQAEKQAKEEEKAAKKQQQLAAKIEELTARVETMNKAKKYCYCWDDGKECDDSKDWVGCSGEEKTCFVNGFVCKNGWKKDNTRNTIKDFEKIVEEANEEDQWFCRSCTLLKAAKS
jgi:hypothetical protein